MTRSTSKPLALLCLVLLWGTFGYTQSIAPQSVNSSGANMTQNHGSLSFTVGELVVLSHIDSLGNTLGGGVTHGATATTVGLQETDASVLDVVVFPNPSSDLVHIRIHHSTLEQVMVSVSDLQGKEIYHGLYAAFPNLISIQTTNLAAGTYVLSLKNNNHQVLGTYHLIKHP